MQALQVLELAGRRSSSVSFFAPPGARPQPQFELHKFQLARQMSLWMCES